MYMNVYIYIYMAFLQIHWLVGTFLMIPVESKYFVGLWDFNDIFLQFDLMKCLLSPPNH
jgi:hypothetical protein